MDITIYPRKLSGTIRAIASKSQAHRFLICAAFSESPTSIECPETNQDIEATVGCLRALGTDITRTNSGYWVIPIRNIPRRAVLDCAESGSTLRFLLPIVCALGIETTIHMSGRLPYRPLSPMWEELVRMGCRLTRPTESTIHTFGKLKCGDFSVAGNVSSQFISGLLFAMALMDGQSSLKIHGKLESRPYVAMTQQALESFGVSTKDFVVNGNYPFSSPVNLTVEGDWSNAAFFLTANAMGSDVTVLNLNQDSPQGDRAIADILTNDEDRPTLSVADIPDLVPIMAVYFATKSGALFTDIARLRLKESDRVQSVCDLLYALGIETICEENTLSVSYGTFIGGTIHSCNDHRIAMAAAIAATVATEPVTILGAECVAKSYPAFWQAYSQLGGKYEQYIR